MNIDLKNIIIINNVIKNFFKSLRKTNFHIIFYIDIVFLNNVHLANVKNNILKIKIHYTFANMSLFPS